ncbi:MAG: thiamine-phosphate kinase [Burkholderiales bacterium]|nr:thiamine-phosphate kinase [Burkholderiales bacterium]
MSPEFDLIAKYFTRPVRHAVLGVGDDCALVRISPGCELAITTDTLVSGTHFFPETGAEKLGHKALAVNLSDLAAMGALPRYVTLALTLPAIDEAWLAAFSRGFFALADKFQVELIGGDTTRGPLSITLTAFGEITIGHAIRRDGAKEGDDIWVSESLGAAALALKHLRGDITLSTAAFERAVMHLEAPNPRIALGRALVGVATSAVDISDGLVADLTHICRRSGLAASVEWPKVPLATSLLSASVEQQRACTLAGGDDYELCFTAPAISRELLHELSSASGLALARIGSMQSGEPLVRVYDDDGEAINIQSSGFDHFAIDH